MPNKKQNIKVGDGVKCIDKNNAWHYRKVGKVVKIGEEQHRYDGGCTFCFDCDGRFTDEDLYTVIHYYVDFKDIKGALFWEKEIIKF